MPTEDQKIIPLRRRLSFQLGVPFVAFIMLVFATVVAGSYISIQFDEATIAGQPRRLSEGAANEIVYFFRSLESSLKVVAESTPSTLILSPVEETYVRNMLRENPTLLEVIFFNERGERVTRIAGPTIPEMLEKNVSDADDADVVDDAHAGEERFLKPIPSIYDTSIVHWIFPIQDQQGNARGSLRATVDLSGLWSILAKYRERNVATLFIADDEGSIIVSNTKLPESAYEEAVRSQIRARMQSKSETTAYQGILGGDVVGFISPIAPTDWSVVAEVPTNSFADRRAHTMTTIVGVFAALIVLLVYELYAVRNMLLRPLDVLNRTISELANGNYKAEARVGVDNEFKALSIVLNGMARNVDKATSSIVVRLQELLGEQDRSSKLLIRRDLELVKANEKLRLLDDAKSEFVSVAAHQLRTPLSAVKWALHMLLGGDLGALELRQKEVLLKAAQSNDRMIKLVNDLLNVDHIESGKSEYLFVPLQVSDLIGSVLAELRPIAEQRSILLNFDSGSAVSGSVLGDRDKLRGVFQNLVENAIKYTLKGGTVTVNLFEEDNLIRVSVADSGIGIPANDQPKVFGKFFRSKNAIKIATDGTGLGLFIVKEIISQHHGKIWFESMEGVGTTFHVSIPKLAEKPNA